MQRNAAFIGFLVLQAVAVAIWLSALLPLAKPDGDPFISKELNVWSGAVFSNVSTNFRAGSQASTAMPFEATGPLLWATVLIVFSGVAAFFAAHVFHREKVWLAVGLAGAAMAMGAGGAFFIVEQWSGDTAFPPGSVNPVWLYMATRSFLIQLVIAFVLLALITVAAIAGFATAQKPFGFRWIAINWIVASVVWVALYVGLHVLPPLGAA